MKKILEYKKHFISNSTEETFKKASLIKIKTNTSIFLNGELGSGKTIFAKGIAHSLGIDQDEITSPTFSIMNMHKNNEITIIHLDLYRIENKDELIDLYIEDYQNDNSISIIEWGKQYIDILANGENIIIVNIEMDEKQIDTNKRKITIQKYKIL